MNVGRHRSAPKDVALAEVIALAEKPLEVDGGGVPAEDHYRVAECCGSCSYYEPDFFCQMFDTEVDPEMVCDKWEADTDVQ